MYKKCFRTVYQEKLVFNFKNSIKRYPKWRECIFSNEKPKSLQDPKALIWALTPSQIGLTLFLLLCCTE